MYLLETLLSEFETGQDRIARANTRTHTHTHIPTELQPNELCSLDLPWEK